MQVQFQVTGKAEENYKRLLATAGDPTTLLRRTLAVFDMIQELQASGGRVVLISKKNERKVLRDVWD